MPTRTLNDFVAPEWNSFGVIRLLAALVVATAHAIEIATGGIRWDVVYEATSYTLGQHAVHLFFVMSGLLVTLSLDRSPSLIDFARARTLRILPGLFVCTLIIVCVVGPLMSSYSVPRYFGDPSVVSYLIQTSLLVTGRAELPGVFDANPLAGQINNSVWTLKYEVLCYAGVGLAAVLARRQPRALVVCLVIVLLVGSYALPSSIPLGTPLDGIRRFALCFSVGSAAYYIRNTLVISAPRLMVVTIVMLILWETNLRIPAMVLFEGYLVLWASSFRMVSISSFTRNHDLSYGIYLYGWPTSQSVLQLAPELGPMWLVIVSLALLIPLAAASWHFVELPAQRLGKSWKKCRGSVHRRKPKGLARGGEKAKEDFGPGWQSSPSASSHWLVVNKRQVEATRIAPIGTPPLDLETTTIC